MNTVVCVVLLQLLQAGVREDHRSLSAKTSSSLSPADRLHSANSNVVNALYDDNDNDDDDEVDDGLEGDFDWAVGPEQGLGPESAPAPGLAAKSQGPGLPQSQGPGIAAHGPGLDDEVSGIRLNNVWHDPRVQGDFSLWRTGPRLMMPSAATPAATTAASSGPVVTQPQSSQTVTASSIYTYYTGLKVPHTPLNTQACLFRQAFSPLACLFD